MFSYDIWGEMRMARFLIILLIITSALMVSSIPYENKPTSWRTPKDRLKFLYLLLAGIAVLVDLSKTFFPIVLLYVASGLVREAYRLVRSGAGRPPRTRLEPHTG
jgi:phosphatidylserine synthase